LPHIKKVTLQAIKSTNISKNLSICTYRGSQILITTLPNSKVVHSCTITKNIYIVSNVKKLVWDKLISVFFIPFLLQSAKNCENQFLTYLTVGSCIVVV